MKFRSNTAIIAVLVFGLTGSVWAQETAPEAEGASPPVVQGIEPVAPYDDKLLRLSEVLGSIHYLRALCGAKEGSKWRDVMLKLIVTEEPGPKRKARLIARFNRGYRAFDGTYGACTDSALVAARRYVAEGANLSAQITGRYGR